MRSRHAGQRRGARDPLAIERWRDAKLPLERLAEGTRIAETNVGRDGGEFALGEHEELARPSQPQRGEPLPWTASIVAMAKAPQVFVTEVGKSRHPFVVPRFSQTAANG